MSVKFLAEGKWKEEKEYFNTNVVSVKWLSSAIYTAKHRISIQMLCRLNRQTFCQLFACLRISIQMLCRLNSKCGVDPGRRCRISIQMLCRLNGCKRFSHFPLLFYFNTNVVSVKFLARFYCFCPKINFNTNVVSVKL